MNQYLLYQAYGSIEIINECRYALLRLIDTYSKINTHPPQVIIYTDKADEFKMFEGKLPITIQQITNDEITRWKGAINFVHRVKIEVIKDCLANFSGKIIYVDTDTYCLQPLEEMFRLITVDNVFFHQFEGTIDASAQFRKWKKFLQGTSILEVEHPSPLHIQMWNAGVIGLEQSHLPLLNEVLVLTDKLYQQFPKHIVEQFSFCYIFQKHKINISNATSFFFHYWNLKEFRRLLQKFFARYKNESVEELAEKSNKVSPEKILLDKLTFVKAGILKKIMLLISGSNWRIGKYNI
jgi:hypothetical protein